jgi:hypothetical protein
VGPELRERAGALDWTLRELRHTFVSLLPDSGVPIEQALVPAGHPDRGHRAGPLFESKGTSNGGQS